MADISSVSTSELIEQQSSPPSFGRYIVQHELGQGGMSVVYLAKDSRLQRFVAIKVLHPHLASRREARQRFIQEATAIARLEHPNILQVFDYATEDERASYIINEYIDGLTLKEWVTHNHIEHCEVVALMMQPIFEALAHAHSQGITHRDVKPENIMIRNNGAPVLMDFGIAHMVDAETLTATGAMIGSPAHMAPEVVNGDELTPLVDIFSMGTVLYWMTCQALPFVAPNPAALFRRILEARFDPVLDRRPSTLGVFSHIIEQCMQRRSVDRPSSAAVIADQLKALLNELSLGHISAELEALSKDPKVYQDSLPKRLVPQYINHAQTAVNQNNLPKALDYLKRAIALDPTDKDAKRLLLRVQRSIRVRSTQRVGGWFVGLLCIGIAGLFYLDSTSPLASVNQVQNQTNASLTTVPEPTQGGTGIGELNPSINLPVVGGIVAPPIERAVRTQEVKPSSRSSKKIKSTRLPKSKLPRALGKINVASRINRAKKIATLDLRPPIMISPPKSVQQRVQISSLYKGAQVYLNGDKVGQIFEIESRGGLSLDVGKKHSLVFKSPYCEEHKRTLKFTEQTERPFREIFECQFRSSKFQIKASYSGEILINAEGKMKRLGFVNQVISYEMNSATQSLNLVIISDNQPSQSLQVKLTAGQLIEVPLQ